MKKRVEACQHFFEVVKNEIIFILKDDGVMLILFGAIFIYSTLYSMAYHNQVVRNEPIAIVDLDQTSTSRSLIRAVDATPQVRVKYEVSSLHEAEQLFFARKIYGCLLIPYNYEKDILSGRQVFVSMYADAGYFLMYKQMLAATTNVIGTENIRIEMANFISSGVSGEMAKALAEPVVPAPVVLYNTIEGYATFVMPAIMILILQQALLLSIGMIGGTFRERKLYCRLMDVQQKPYSVFNVVIGKALAYFVFSLLISIVVFGIYYKLFHYPDRGAFIDVTLFFIPYLLSVIFLSLTISAFFRYRETSVLVLVAWSIPFLLFSGVSFPKEGMPEWFYSFGKIIPSSNAIDGFIRMEVMGATLKEVLEQYRMLWILTAVYFLTAMIALRVRLHKEIPRCLDKKH